MPHLPPVISEADFQAVDTADEEQIKKRFGGFVRSWHDYLNDLPCLQDIQRVRRRWRGRVASTDAFGTFATDPRHWYSFHHGGRTEAQFNLGLYPTHLRIGLGFEFSLKKGGDPTKVHLAYACFLNVIRSEIDLFKRFLRDAHLEVEWVGTGDDSLRFVATEDALQWLLEPPREPQWIFIGRLLRRGQDSTSLEQLDKLATTAEQVLCGFKPLWEQTQQLAHVA